MRGMQSLYVKEDCSLKETPQCQIVQPIPWMRLNGPKIPCDSHSPSNASHASSQLPNWNGQAATDFDKIEGCIVETAADGQLIDISAPVEYKVYC